MTRHPVKTRWASWSDSVAVLFRFDQLEGWKAPRHIKLTGGATRLTVTALLRNHDNELVTAIARLSVRDGQIVKVLSTELRLRAVFAGGIAQ